MKKIFSFGVLQALIGVALFLPSATTYAAVSPVVIKTYGQHIGGNIVYTHLVTNSTMSPLVSFAIGEYSNKDNPGIKDFFDRGEIRVLPVGSTDDVLMGPVRPGSASGLPGWGAEIILIEESGLYMHWGLYENPSAPRIQPGQTARFSVTVPKVDSAYLTGHFRTSDDYNGTMEKLDSTPPVLSFTLNPAATAAIQRGQMVPINALISVTDDYDPAPEIKLESITSNETLGAADVQGANLGTDDRSFSVLATSYLPVGRVYVITYSATDASGNTAKQYVFLKVN